MTREGFALHELILDGKGTLLDSRFLSVNRAWGELVGTPNSVAIGQTMKEACPELASQWHDVFRTVAGTGESSRREAFDTQSQRWRDTLVFSLAENRVASLVLDITELKLAEQAIADSEQRYRELFEASPVALFLSETLCDAAGQPVDCRLQYVNPAFERFVHARAADLVGRTLLEFNPQTDRRMIRRLGQVGLTGVSDAWEGYSERFSTYYEATVFSPRFGQCVTFLADTTGRKRAEDALSQALDREREAVTAGNVGLWDWNLRTNRVHYSAEWKRQIGYGADELSDDFSEWQTRVHPEDLDRCLESVRQFLASSRPHNELEFRFRHRDGSYRSILAHSSVMRDDDGQPMRMMGSHVDVTAWVTLQAQFMQAQKMESIGRLAGGVAHDFNNLLTVINGTAELAMAGLRHDDPLLADLDAIRQAADRAGNLTRQLLVFSRQQVVEPKLLDLNRVIGEMEKMLRRLIGEDIALTFAPSPDLGFIRADAGHIEQMLLNLAVNARDAMPQGGTITIATANVELDETVKHLRPSPAAGSYVVLSFSDTGTGMDPGTQARVFEPFFTTKPAGKGTGLGLSTVCGIVTQNGGRIGIQSEVGRGASFSIYLPRVAAPVGEGQQASSEGHHRGSGTILLVEDDAAVRRFAERALTLMGYRVLAAANAGEALLIFEQSAGAVRLVVTDVVMPGMSGRQLAERLRQTRPDVRVLFASGYTDDAVLTADLLEAPNHFINKPYSVSALTRKVHEALSADN